MMTLRIRQTCLAMTMSAGFFMAVGCGADASDMASASPRSSREGVPAHASNRPSVERASQIAPEDPPITRPSTKEACDGCQGLWSAHGIEPEETCICKTNDEGRECTDGHDCQGECLLDGDAEFHVMDAADPARGYYRGYCAGYDTTFGCFRHVPADIQSQLPLTAEEASEIICVD
ncbi:MAG TPA: hypothetical protein VK550_25300 [Polyangiaceae bacterium]|nr:hypothetical protein [Polyangiaceae bacterium]